MSKYGYLEVFQRVPWTSRYESRLYNLLVVYAFHSLHIKVPAHNKTYNKTCMTSIDSDQPVHLHNMAKGLIPSSLNCLKDVEGTCDRRKL